MLVRMVKKMNLIVNDMKEMIRRLWEMNVEKLEVMDGIFLEKVHKDWNLTKDGIPRMADVPKLTPVIQRFGNLKIADMVYLSRRFNMPIGLTQLFLVNIGLPILHIGDRAWFNLNEFEKKINELSKPGGYGIKVRKGFLEYSLVKNAFGLTRRQQEHYNNTIKEARTDRQKMRELEKMSELEV